MEKKNGQSRLIHSLWDNNDVLIEPAEIRRRTVEFYSALYASDYQEDPNIAHKFFEGLPKVPAEMNAVLEQPLSLPELCSAVMNMANGKAPGIDGIPIEFYKTFWSIMGSDLLAVFNESFAKERLPLSCRRAVLTLLPKKGDLRDIANWRPVSLLCADYKALSKTLANRLKNAMNYVIHSDQSYCVPGRSIFDNISFIRDLLYTSNLFGFKFGLFSMDQEKAFDRVEHKYLWSTMEAFNFSSVFLNMVKVKVAPYRVCCTL